MKLTDLKPRWFDVPGVGTNKDGITFLCPCDACKKLPEPRRLAVQFANPIGSDPLPQMTQKEKNVHLFELRTFDVAPSTLWQRTGETFEDLTLSPSVDASKSGHWHGYISNGQIT
jgi:hypothetical protein